MHILGIAYSSIMYNYKKQHMQVCFDNSVDKMSWILYFIFDKIIIS